MEILESTTEEAQFVSFDLAGETHGIPISIVHEIIRLAEITPVPRTAEYVLGVVNLRGKIVPVVDVRRRLGIEPAEMGPSSRIIVVDSQAGVVGLLVDSVSQVFRLRATDIDPPSDLITDVDAALIRGVGKHSTGLIVILDVEKILSGQRRAAA